MIEIQLTQGKVTQVDDEFAFLEQYKWFAHKTTSTANFRYYAIRKISLNGVQSAIHMHRVIMESELLPRPKGRGFPAASWLLCRHSPLASGHVLREFSVLPSSSGIWLIQGFPTRPYSRKRSLGTGKQYSGCSLPTIVTRISPCDPPHSCQPRTNYGTGVMRNQSSIALSADGVTPYGRD